VPVTGSAQIRAVLRIRPFRRLWLVLGLSSLGDWLGLRGHPVGQPLDPHPKRPVLGWAWCGSQVETKKASEVDLVGKVRKPAHCMHG
jgi:hypothetical protein